MLSSKELLELASLDALGLLDEDERRAFETAFRAADPALQAQVRLEQTRATRLESLLPKVAPPIGLRARVLAAVRAAIAESAAAIPFRGPSSRLLVGPGVSPMWRAAAISFAAGSLVLAVATYRLRSESIELRQVYESSQMVDEWREAFGPRFQRMFFSPETRRVCFVEDTTGSEPAPAALLWDSAKGTAFLYAMDLPADGTYDLVLLDEQGNVVRTLMVAFRSIGRPMEQAVPGSFEFDAAGSIALVQTVGTQTRILRGADWQGTGL